MVRVLFEEALSDDQGEEGERQEHLEETFSGGWFHYGAQPVINRFTCQALPRRFYGIPSVYGVEIVQSRCVDPMVNLCRKLSQLLQISARKAWPGGNAGMRGSLLLRGSHFPAAWFSAPSANWTRSTGKR